MNYSLILYATLIKDINDSKSVNDYVFLGHTCIHVSADSLKH